MKRSRQSGFTLVEIMVVMGLISLLIVITISGIRKNWEPQEIRASAIKLASDLALASQLAVKMNKPVEVRFYQFQDVAIANPNPQFRGYQLMVLEPITATQGIRLPTPAPLYELQRFEGTTIMSSYTKYSSLAGRAQSPQPGDRDLGIGDYKYQSVEFRPDGTTDLPPPAGGQWTITLGPVRWLDNAAVTPADYQCISIDWANGAVRLY